MTTNMYWQNARKHAKSISIFQALVYSLVVFNTFFKLLLFLQLSLRNLNFFTALRMYPKIISRIVFIIFSHLVVVIFSEIWRKYLIRYSLECICVSWKHIHTSLYVPHSIYIYSYKTYVLSLYVNNIYMLHVLTSKIVAFNIYVVIIS